MATDLYAENFKESVKLTFKIVKDIKSVYKEKGFTNQKVKLFNTTTRYSAVEMNNDTLYIYDNDNQKWHSDNVRDIYVLLEILRAMYHVY